MVCCAKKNEGVGSHFQIQGMSSLNQRHSGTSNCDGDMEDEAGSVLCVPGSRVVCGGISMHNCPGNFVKFVNAGGRSMEEIGDLDSKSSIMHDIAFEGGDVFRTDESIINSGNLEFLYQSARVGNFCYRFDNLSARDYFVDLYFSEIINLNGPKGMRVFDVFIQDEKVICELDIYSVVKANSPLQLIDIRVSAGDDGVILLRFEGVRGSPIVSGICIKEAPLLPVTQGCAFCQDCAAQNKHMRANSTAKYEKKINELSTQFQLKTNECYEAWMSWTALNEQLEKINVELDNKSFQYHCLDQAMVLQTAELRDVSSRYEYEKKFWVAAINELEKKIKAMKQEHSRLSHEANNCANSVPDLNKMVSAIGGLVSQCEDLKLKYSEEQVKTKKLYNQIQEAKGNIRVFCRCRPLTEQECSAGHAAVVDFNASKDGDLGILTGGSTKKMFKFDRVYTPKDDQVDVFADASPMVISTLDGYNVCIFAYGQTGTGKTFTMEGIENNRGVNYRTLEQLFEVVEERKDTFTYNITVSVLEVYNEQIRDLLATSPTSKRLEIRQASEGFHHVPGIVEAKVQNIKEVWNVLQMGSNARAVGSNNVNDHSSRSHCMICIMVRAKNLMNGECTKSKLWLVDLAGSERLAKTDVQGDRLKEAQNINRSLSALGDVISALSAKSSHIPYRNSKLTHLLQDSLGGDSKTLMFVQISPLEQDLSETLSSLNFATRVRGVELGPAKKQIEMGELQKLKLLLEKAKQESKLKEEALRKSEENLQNVEGKAKSKDQIFKNQQEKVNELEGQLEKKTQLCRDLEKQMLWFSARLKEKEEICSTLEKKVNVLENKLEDHDYRESTILSHKVKEVENRWKERIQEFELQSLIFKEKIKELEEKLRQNQDLHLKGLPTNSSEKLKVTANERRALSVVETPISTGSCGLGSLKSSYHSGRQESTLLTGTDSLRGLRRKWDCQSRGIENNIFSSSLPEKKVLPTVSSNARLIDPTKALARVTRTPKTSSTAQRSTSNNRSNKEQVSGANENGSSNRRVWLR